MEAAGAGRFAVLHPPPHPRCQHEYGLELLRADNAEDETNQRSREQEPQDYPAGRQRIECEDYDEDRRRQPSPRQRRAGKVSALPPAHQAMDADSTGKNRAGQACFPRCGEKKITTKGKHPSAATIQRSNFGGGGGGAGGPTRGAWAVGVNSIARVPCSGWPNPYYNDFKLTTPPLGKPSGGSDKVRLQSK